MLSIKRDSTRLTRGAGENFLYVFKGAQSAPGPAWPLVLASAVLRCGDLGTAQLPASPSGPFGGAYSALGFEEPLQAVQAAVRTGSLDGSVPIEEIVPRWPDRL